MKRTHKYPSLTKVVVALPVICFAAIAPAMARYKIISHTMDGGGGTSRGKQFVISGTIGQPDADWARGKRFEMLGGFWPGGPRCIVQFDDFARFAQLWLDTGPGLAADLDDDQDVDFADVQTFADFWLSYCPYAWPLK
ncbi:MAG: hypothetical protein H8E73_09130 [Planctomycetes bacterium]|nr:hypothetical protein [Planctomycetota bacterium]